MLSSIDWTTEWLETNGLGGFATGTATGERTRRYHALLVTDRQQRIVLVNALEVWAQTSTATYPLSTQIYDGGVRFPEGQQWLQGFTHYPCPTWHYSLPDGTSIKQEIILAQGHEACIVRWTRVGGDALRLHVRPLLSGRDYHSLQHEYEGFDFSFRRIHSAAAPQTSVLWQPNSYLPGIVASVEGDYTHDPKWFHRFYYHLEHERGLDFLEDLASPGEFHFELSDSPQELTLCADTPVLDPKSLFAMELARRSKLTPLKLAASQYIVNREGRDTIIAGYPWFTDWGRDTFIALRGLCLASGQFEIAKNILLAWSQTVSEGMLPNRFPDGHQPPEYNSVDASLWFVVATNEFLSLTSERSGLVSASESSQLIAATEAILHGYWMGTRHEIHMDDDGLIAAGEPGVQLTWMDAKVNDWVVTPRIGKPVEIQALWLNGLWLAGRRNKKWSAIFDETLPVFRQKFWNETEGCLYDVVDVNHAAGAIDASFRPNQLFAVGGLPYVLIEGRRARSIVDQVQQRLWTPMGLRTLAPEDANYCGEYGGSAEVRDAAYHQGTVWPWLLGPFVDAWLRVRGNSPESVREAQQKFWAPIEKYMEQFGLGHISEVASGNAPHRPGGCPFQAWSLGEYLRVCKPVINGRSKNVAAR
ncbi:MAG: amylo-alpha-1,6-glucosidase [Planctomycetaceae bacterium]